ncbi:class I adenylate-forming enzyme family protein [Sinorhizobium sp. 22678]|uniref:class I adenylate-forming enzyme family protein n=1 Tax=Sinorhizobium sp. 22678 TaxID=3453955 RepID=UPI003F8569E8
MSNVISSTLGWTVSSILGDTGPQVLHQPEKLALVWEHGALTYGQLRSRALKLAGAFRAAGLQTGDRVASMLYNRGEIFELYFACAFAGLVFVPVSFRLTASEVASILDDSGAKLFFVETETSPVAEDASRAIANGPKLVVLEANAGGSAYEAFADACPSLASAIPHDVQMILYTSGTTGKPKGVVMRSLAVIWCAMQQASIFKQMNQETVMLLNAPMYNTAALNESSIPTFLVGGTVAIMPSRGWSAERLGEFIQKWNVSHALIFPSMFRNMIEADDREPLPLQSMKWWYTGGENCPPALIAEARRRWPHIHLAIAYGSTECGLPTLIDGDDIDLHPGSVGRCVPGQSIRLLDADGNLVPPGGVGDVWTAGPAVMNNYWNAPQLDTETVRDGWLRIGDLATIDDEGWIRIVGRSKDLIISKGQNIYPAEIENVIRQHPAVIDVAVVGLPDEEFTEVVCAAIVPRKEGTISKEEIMAFLLTKLASYKKPRHIVFVDSFPIRNATKVDKKELASICAKILAI